MSTSTTAPHHPTTPPPHLPLAFAFAFASSLASYAWRRPHREAYDVVADVGVGRGHGQERRTQSAVCQVGDDAWSASRI